LRRENSTAKKNPNQPIEAVKNYLECRFFDMKLDFFVCFSCVAGMKSAVKFITFAVSLPFEKKFQQSLTEVKKIK
jgi:hypothetical protein